MEIVLDFLLILAAYSCATRAVSAHVPTAPEARFSAVTAGEVLQHAERPPDGCTADVGTCRFSR